LGKYSKFASAGDKANVRTAVDALSRERTGDTHNPDAEGDAAPASSDDSSEAKEVRKDAPF
jgi:myo-inositol-1(or 4)-monophosphatase